MAVDPFPDGTADDTTYCRAVGSIVPASSIPAQPSLGLHLGPANNLPCYDPPVPGCRSFVTQGDPGTTYMVYLLATDLDGEDSRFLGMRAGIAYDPGVSVLNWGTCSLRETRRNGWPASGGSIEIQSLQCQGTDGEDGSIRLLGYFRLYTDEAADFRLTEFAEGTPAAVFDCYLNPLELESGDLGRIGLGPSPGYAPCLGNTAVLPTTWGRIKAQFAGEADPD
jgi:hypothetical protein